MSWEDRVLIFGSIFRVSVDRWCCAVIIGGGLGSCVSLVSVMGTPPQSGGTCLSSVTIISVLGNAESVVVGVEVSIGCVPIVGDALSVCCRNVLWFVFTLCVVCSSSSKVVEYVWSILWVSVFVAVIRS